MLMTNRPATKEELFNLRHATLRNAIERIFGIVKNRFVILQHGSDYHMKYQVRIPPACCALHNFIRIHDPTEFNDFQNIHEDPNPVQLSGSLAETVPTPQERAQANSRRDYIAQQMWSAYQEIIGRDEGHTNE